MDHRQQQAPETYVLFFSRNCTQCMKFCNLLERATPSLKQQIKLYDVEQNPQNLPPNLRIVPAIYIQSQQALHQGPNAFQWLKDEFNKIKGVAPDATNFSFFDRSNAEGAIDPNKSATFQVSPQEQMMMQQRQQQLINQSSLQTPSYSSSASVGSTPLPPSINPNQPPPQAQMQFQQQQLQSNMQSYNTPPNMSMGMPQLPQQLQPMQMNQQNDAMQSQMSMNKLDLLRQQRNAEINQILPPMQRM